MKLGLDKLPDEGLEHRFKLTVYNDSSTAFHLCGPSISAAFCAEGCASPELREGCFLGFELQGWTDGASGDQGAPQWKVLSGTVRYGCGPNPLRIAFRCTIRRNPEAFEAGETEAFVIGFPRSATDTGAKVLANLGFSCLAGCEGVIYNVEIPNAELVYRTEPTEESHSPSPACISAKRQSQAVRRFLHKAPYKKRPGLRRRLKHALANVKRLCQ